MANENLILEALGITGESDLEALEKELSASDELKIPEVSEHDTSISWPKVLQELNWLTEKLKRLLEKQPNNPFIAGKYQDALKTKLTLLGMTRIKPDMQSAIDAEVNNYKKRVLEIVGGHMETDKMERFVEELSKEGL